MIYYYFLGFLGPNFAKQRSAKVHVSAEKFGERKMRALIKR